MVMLRRSAWHKNNRREIKHTLERYIAILAIITLGVGFFSGLKITRTAMVNNLDNYVSKFNMYDYRLISTLGLTDEDVQHLSEQNNMTAEGTITIDFVADMGTDNRFVLKAHSLTDSVNKLNILHGRAPEAANECVLDSLAFTEDVIGSKIHMSSTNEEDTFEAFAYDEYTVVGIADSVNYINYDRGSTSLASGSVLGFVYMPKDGFATDYYTEIMIKLNGESEVYSSDYKDMISSYEPYLKEELTNRAELRYQEILGEAREKLFDGQKEYDEAYDEYLTEKADAEEELELAWEKLRDADTDIKENEEKLRDAELKLADGEQQLENSLQEYDESYSKFQSEKSNALALIETRQAELSGGRQATNSAMVQIKESGVLEQYAQLEENIASLEVAISQIDNPNSEEYITIQNQLAFAKAAVSEIEATGILKQYAELESTIATLEAGQREINQGREEATDRFEAAEVQLADAKKQLDSGKDELEKNKLKILDGWKALEEGKEEYNKGLTEYQDGKAEAEEAFTEAEEELAKAQKEIDDAWAEIEDIPEAKVYVLNRNSNIGYAAFDNDSAIVDGIAKVLPIFFFLVAALVCSTTMTRMVEEQRTQIGTLKAIGYSNGAITRKYISYSGSAAVIGCAIGYILGTKFFPLAIWEAYGMLYKFSPIEYVFDWKLALISLIVSLICSAGVTYITCKTELLQMPAQLIRPKSPKAGKRVLLERLPFIWKRISFLHKVSIRNILRYKKRFFMTVIGIAGCTSLVVAAMGISDSIRNVANDQFGSIMIYDYSISFSEGLTVKEMEQFTEDYSDELYESVFVSLDEVEVAKGNIIKKVSTVATDDPNITKVIGLQLGGKTVPYPLDGKVVVNNKLAKEFGLDKGDTITIKINETDTVEAEVGGIFENYMGNYLFMTGKTYEMLYDEKPIYQNAYGSTDKEDIYSVSAKISQADYVTTVTVLNDMRTMVSNMMQSMDYIIWLVIACAGALGFVVIYNLNNINITERSREIATIKVLGFYSRETQTYVFRETLILTTIGALVGLGLGKLLHGFIMNQINVDMVSFKVQIFGKSYLISFIVTFIVTLLVNLMLRKKIERINMAESLKSIE